MGTCLTFEFFLPTEHELSSLFLGESLQHPGDCPEAVTMIEWLSQSTLMRPDIPDWLEEIGERLSNNDPRMTTLELTHYRVDDAQARFLAGKLQQNTTVNILLLSCYNMIDDGPVAIAAVLKGSQTIQKIQLRDLRNAREATIFFEALSAAEQLEELSLRNNHMNTTSGKKFYELLASHRCLQEVRLVDCQMSGTALSQVSFGVQSSLKLRRLHLINTEITGDYGGRCLGDMVRHNSTLHELCLAENNLGDEGTTQLTDGLMKNSSIKTLDLRSNEIGHAGSSSLSAFIKKSKSLATLILGANRIGDKGAEVLAQGLRVCGLCKIDLSDNGIGPLGAKAVAAMLLENNSLREINMSFNFIGDIGATSIATVLDANTTLRSLSIRRIQMSNDGAHALGQQLPRMRGLKELIMTQNKVDQIGALALLEGVRRNMELENLHIESKVSEPILREIIHWIRLNKAGRRVFRDSKLPVPVWPDVLSKLSVNADLDVMYHFVSEKPDVYRYAHPIKALGC